MSDKFSSKLGFLLASVGSAVGLGSIWRFPYMVSEYGQGTFIVMYLISVFLIGIPLVLSEYVIGKISSDKPHGIGIVSIWKTFSNKKWQYRLSYIFVFTSWLVYTYYMVICGWVIVYFFKSLFGVIDYSNINIDYYQSLLNKLYISNIEVIGATVLAFLITGFISIKGVSKGIEKLTTIGMPLLFIMILIILTRVLTLEGAINGIKQYFSISSNDFNIRNMLSAMGQAFYALSLGLGILVTYASYVKSDNNLLNTSIGTSAIISLVAILAGVMIVTALVVFGLGNEKGPGLIFISLPAIFSQMYGGVIFAVVFFGLVIVAAFSATIALLEVIVPVLIQSFNITRTKAIAIVTSISMVISIFQILSFNKLSHITIFGKNIFSFSDYLTSSTLLPVGALITCLCLGFIINKQVVSKLTQFDQRYLVKHLKVYEIWFFWIKYILPLIIFILLVGAIFNGFKS